MNTPDDRKPTPDDPPGERSGWRSLDVLRLEAEWQAQERALEQERRGVPLDRADSRLAEYRLIARALRAPAMEPVPYDLTAQIVRHVEGTPAVGELLERWLLRALTAAFVLAALSAMVAYGAQWTPAFADLWPQLSPASADWAGLLIGCLAVSLAWQGVVRLMRQESGGTLGLA
ncbi:hypothetical protein JI752_015500 [Lysobacter sp. MMG2]|uniref:hypothetical protein n=1 Tax=Lysobacter sp. MMG2 TaxID=2801338 RepID=UPI001C231F0E|nr:hypothetical protein [Lysobacter sp. MMG2]MBU8977556.1 hypothetical protein [Lysobacter sp. MMG2]